MNLIDGRKFLATAFIEFPGVWDFIKTHSPKPQLTIDAWAKALEQITLEEAYSVLVRWTNGTIPAPTGFEKETFHLRVIEVVKADRKAAWEVRNRNSILRNTRCNIQDMVPGLGPYMEKVVNRINAHWQGALSEAELREQLNKLEREAIDELENAR